jgi:hypothetical protein
MVCGDLECNEEVVLQYNESSPDEPPGFGLPAERIPATAEHLRKFIPLAVIPNWRHIFSNSWKVPQGLKIDGKTFDSVTAFYESEKSKYAPVSTFYSRDMTEESSTPADKAMQKALDAKFTDANLKTALLASHDAKLMIVLPGTEGMVKDTDLMKLRNRLQQSVRLTA